jgi:hypothetical protein
MTKQLWNIKRGDKVVVILGKDHHSAKDLLALNGSLCTIGTMVEDASKQKSPYCIIALSVNRACFISLDQKDEYFAGTIIKYVKGN